MKTITACLLTACCVLALGAAWDSPLAISGSGENRYVFLGRDAVHVVLAAEGERAWVGARSANGLPGWAITSGRDGTATLQVRDEKGEAITVDLLKAARILKSLGG